MPWSSPSSAKLIPFGPFTKGMDAESAATAVANDEFVFVHNMMPSGRGLSTRPGYSLLRKFSAPSGSAREFPFRPIDFITIWDTDGIQSNIVLTDKGLVNVNDVSSPLLVAWTYSTGTVAASGTSATGSGTAWLSADVMQGDLFYIGSRFYTIEKVVDDTHITLVETLEATFSAGSSYEIQRAFGPGTCVMPDWAVCEGKLLIADGKRSLYAYDPDSGLLGYWSTSSAKFPGGVEFSAGTVCVFDDRVWVGDLNDTVDGTVRQRIRWSALADRTDFSIVTSYADLTYLSGAVRKMMPLNDSLIVYFDDGIYRGDRTSFPLAPLMFSKVESGGAGIAGPHCVCSAPNMHYFIGPSDFFRLDETGVYQLPNKVRTMSSENIANPALSYVVEDVMQEAIVFGVYLDDPSRARNVTLSDAEMARFRYYPKRDAWTVEGSMTAVNAMLATPYIAEVVSWDELPGDWDTVIDTYPTWLDMVSGGKTQLVVLGTYDKYATADKAVMVIENDGAMADLGLDVEESVLTKEYDFGEPDSLKTFTELVLDISKDGPFVNSLTISVEASGDGGTTFRSLGNLSFGAADNKAYINFRFTAPSIMLWFRVASIHDNPFHIRSFSLRVRGSGVELSPPNG